MLGNRKLGMIQDRAASGPRFQLSLFVKIILYRFKFVLCDVLFRRVVVTKLVVVFLSVPVEVITSMNNKISCHMVKTELKASLFINVYFGSGVLR